jgi:hypothetical protein
MRTLYIALPSSFEKMEISPNADFYGSLKYLDSMGFTDVGLNQRALYKTNGNVHQAIELIMNPSLMEERSIPKQTTQYIFPKLSQDQAEKVLQVAQLGFEDEGKIRHALTLQNWNTEQAIDLLLDNDSRLKSDFSSSNSIAPTLPARPAYSQPFGNTFTPFDPFNTPQNQPLKSNVTPKVSNTQEPLRTRDPYNAFRQPHQPSVFSNQVMNQDPFSDENASNRQKIQEFDPFSDSNKL